MSKKKDSLTTAVSAEMKSNFNLDKFKEKKLLNSTVKFKEQKWIPFSEALQDSTSLPGAAMGHINLLRGHSNTGKTTALLELAINAQKMGILPVFIITEMKWSWEHAKQMGFQVEDVVDTTTGEIVDYKGFFLYNDRSALGTIEDVAEFIADLLDEQ
jgi:RecA/RadA recombinase